MKIEVENPEVECPNSEIAAYLDGELTPSEELDLVAHMARCPQCRAEFNSQKGLLSVLDAALTSESSLPQIPEDFARTVTVRAESSVSGIRKPAETHRALVVGAFLLVAAAAGFALNPSVSLVPIERIGVQAMAVGSFLLHFAMDLGTGVGIVLRSFGQSVFHGSFLVVSLSAVLFVVTAAALSRMVSRYRRTL